jgi:transcriptional regulator with XRE-family HTH domain
MDTTMPARPVGELLREWRERRHLSQLALALDADVSARHVSFLETGRAHPSREMVLRLAEQLEVPLRERNGLLLAAGYAPVYPERGLDDPALAVARDAIDRVLTGHEPYPALAVDRHWNLVAANRAVDLLLAGVSPHLLQPPINALRVSLHPDGMAPRIANLAEWRAHILTRLSRQIALTADAELSELRTELATYAQDPVHWIDAHDAALSWGVVVPLRLRSQQGMLSFLSTTMVFGTPVDLTLAELAIEAFFPADSATAEVLTRSAAIGSDQV